MKIFLVTYKKFPEKLGHVATDIQKWNICREIGIHALLGSPKSNYTQQQWSQTCAFLTNFDFTRNFLSLGYLWKLQIFMGRTKYVGNSSIFQKHTKETGWFLRLIVNNTSINSFTESFHENLISLCLGLILDLFQISLCLKSWN